MDDVLKLAEEALEPFAFFERQWKEARRNAIRPAGDNIYGIHTNTEFEAMLTHSQLQAADYAIAAIRAARAECGWRPIAEMEVVEDNGVTLGMWRNGAWVTTPEVWYRSWAVDHGYTHFHRPQLPPPPQEGDHGE